MAYAIKLTHIKTKKRLYYGDYSGKTISFETVGLAEETIKQKFHQKQLNAKVVILPLSLT